MEKRDNFIKKFMIVSILIGFLSPSITFKGQSKSTLASIDIKKEKSLNLLITDISISLFNEAEARSKRGYHKRKRRKYHKKRSNYRRHHRKRDRRYRRRYRRDRRRSGVGNFVAGMAVGALINSATKKSRCEIVYIKGLRYKDCGGTLRRY